MSSDTLFRLAMAVLILLVAAVVVAPRGAQQPAGLAAGIPASQHVDTLDSSGIPVSGLSVEDAAALPGASPVRTPRPSAKPSERPRGTAARTKAGPRPTTSARTVTPKPLRHALSGTATYYCLPGRSRCTVGYGPNCACAAAGSALRLAMGSWRGRYVTVHYGRNEARVRLIDCLCSSGLIDLYGSVFGQLAPLSAGRIRVTVTW